MIVVFKKKKNYMLVGIRAPHNTRCKSMNIGFS